MEATVLPEIMTADPPHEWRELAEGVRMARLHLGIRHKQHVAFRFDSLAVKTPVTAANDLDFKVIKGKLETRVENQAGRMILFGEFAIGMVFRVHKGEVYTLRNLQWGDSGDDAVVFCEIRSETLDSDENQISKAQEDRTA